MPRAKNKVGETYYPLTESGAREWYKLKYLNTTGYLLVIKRLSVRPESNFVIDNVVQFCKDWGIAKSSFYRAVNTLTLDGQIDWEATQGIILKPSQKVVPIAQAGQCPTNGTVSHERDSVSHERDSVSHERDSVSHERDSDIYIDRTRDRSIRSNSDLSDLPPNPPLKGGLERESEDVWEEEAEESSPQVNPVLAATEIETKQESTVLGEGKGSAGAIQKLAYHHFGMQDPNDRRSRQQREFNWVPEGPWRVDNQLDAAFVDWMASKWQRDYGKDLHTTRANVLRHLKKDAANVAIAWDEYHRETLHRFSNAAVRERAGIEIKLEERQELVAHTGAIASLPPEIAPVSSAIPQPVQENSVILASMPQQALPTVGGGVLEPYKEWKPSEAAASVSLEEARENIERLKELSRTGFRLKSLPQAEKTPETTIEILQDLLSDPICRKDASIQAKARAFLESNPEATAEYGMGGIVTAIYDF